MIDVLLVEDNPEKRESIVNEIKAFFGADNVSLDLAENFAQATKMIFEQSYALIVVDLLLPRRLGDEPADVSDELVEHLRSSSSNLGANVVAMSMYPDVVEERRKSFVESGIVLIHFDPDKPDWTRSLNVCLQRTAHSRHFDFAVLCALDKERNAFRRAGCDVGELTVIGGLDCLRLTVDGLHGVCVKPPRMGLVDASIVATRIMDVLTPRVVCMSGICAGISDDATLGTLIVSDVCWEHQAGKWKEDAFEQGGFQANMNGELRNLISQFIERERRLDGLKEDLTEDQDLLHAGVLLSPTVTGSAVIASADRTKQIGGQHRKLAGLDMEMYGMYRAAEISPASPYCFGAKTVVDLATESKGDKYHAYGAWLSARFVISVLREMKFKELLP